MSGINNTLTALDSANNNTSYGLNVGDSATADVIIGMVGACSYNGLSVRL